MTAIYRILLPLVLLLSLPLVLFSNKYRRGYVDRIGVIRRVRKLALKRPIWFHFSSAGEFEQCIGIIDEIKRRSPQTAIFLTHFSPSGKTAVARESARRNGNVPWDGADYLPFDTYWNVRFFLQTLGPSALFIVNREWWPELIRQASERMPTGLIATYLFKPLSDRFRPLLGQIHWVGTVDDATLNTLSEAGVPRVETLGDPRLERIASRRMVSPPAWAAFFPTKTIVFGSLWPADIEALGTSFSVLHRSGWRLVLVPHEPNNRMNRRLLSLFEKDCRLWSQFLRVPDERSHLVVDTVGALRDLYSVARAAFVGNSFSGKVHNVAEPAVCGIPVLTGPRIENSAEAKALRDLGVVRILQSGGDLPDALEEALRGKAAIRLAAKEFFDRQHGISAKYAGRCLEVAGDDQSLSKSSDEPAITGPTNKDSSLY